MNAQLQKLGSASTQVHQRTQKRLERQQASYESHLRNRFIENAQARRSRKKAERQQRVARRKGR